MKGDQGHPVKCPLECGAIIDRSKVQLKRRGVGLTERQIIRHGVREHLNLRHSELSKREVSLWLDVACGDTQRPGS